MSIFDEYHDLEGHHCPKCCNLETCHDLDDHIEYEVADQIDEIIEDAEQVVGIASWLWVDTVGDFLALANGSYWERFL